MGSHLPCEGRRAETMKRWAWPARGLLLPFAGGVPPNGAGRGTGTGTGQTSHAAGRVLAWRAWGPGAVTEPLAAFTDAGGQENRTAGQEDRRTALHALSQRSALGLAVASLHPATLCGL